MPAKVTYNSQQISTFCKKWRVRELALFGSVLREDFDPESDVDVLVEFEPDAKWSLWDWPDMMDELKAAIGRQVDLVEKGAVVNPFRRRYILNNHEVIYAA